MAQISILLAANHEHKTNHWVTHKLDFAITYHLALHTFGTCQGGNGTSCMGKAAEHKWKEQK